MSPFIVRVLQLQLILLIVRNFNNFDRVILGVVSEGEAVSGWGGGCGGDVVTE